jgi:ABC-2 type transport system permease protein
MNAALHAQLRAELQLVMRNGEQILLTLGIPILLLVFFGTVDVLPINDVEDTADFLLPGVLALAVMSTSMVSLGIATGFERSYQVLKRLGATPLGRGRLVVAKILTVFVVEVIQLAVLIPIGLAIGWRPESALWALSLLVILGGTAAFAGIGLTMAGRLRGEINLAAQNGLYLLLLLLGGMIIPLDELPGPLAAVGRVLPSGALSDLMLETLNNAGDNPLLSAIVLAIWAVIAPLVAARTFRWN